MGEIVFLIPILALSIPIIAIWTKHQRTMAELQMQGTSEDAAQHASHTRELEERIKVLERIITDRGYDLATQIEALRDETPALSARKIEEKL